MLTLVLTWLLSHNTMVSMNMRWAFGTLVILTLKIFLMRLDSISISSTTIKFQMICLMNSSGETSRESTSFQKLETKGLVVHATSFPLYRAWRVEPRSGMVRLTSFHPSLLLVAAHTMKDVVEVGLFWLDSLQRSSLCLWNSVLHTRHALQATLAETSLIALAL